MTALAEIVTAVDTVTADNPDVWLLVGYGANSVSATLMAFPTLQAGAEHLAPLGLTVAPDGRVQAPFDLEEAFDAHAESEEEWREAFGDAPFVDTAPTNVDSDAEPDAESPYRSLVNSLRAALFTGYYGGCGGCYRLALKPVRYGSPMHDWDLD